MATKDARERFTITADAYSRHRPTYPHELVDWIVRAATLPADARIVDLGSGTGIATRQLAAWGFDVTGVEPNEAMLSEAQAHPDRAGGATYVRGEANATGLASTTYHLVTSAQAFHWFDVPTTMVEIGRILKPDGHATAFWNIRGGTPFMDAYEALLRSFGAYQAVPKPREAIARIEASPLITSLQSAEFSHVQTLDRAALSGRAWSSSYVAHGVTDKAAFERDLDVLFATYATNESVAFTYVTTARMWSF